MTARERNYPPGPHELKAPCGVMAARRGAESSRGLKRSTESGQDLKPLTLLDGRSAMVLDTVILRKEHCRRRRKVQEVQSHTTYWSTQPASGSNPSPVRNEEVPHQDAQAMVLERNRDGNREGATQVRDVAGVQESMWRGGRKGGVRTSPHCLLGRHQDRLLNTAQGVTHRHSATQVTKVARDTGHVLSPLTVKQQHSTLCEHQHGEDCPSGSS